MTSKTPHQPPSRETLTETLRALPMFAGADEASLAEMAASAVWRTYRPGEMVFLEGESAPALYILERGWLKVVKMAPDGREQVLRFLGPGESFNEVVVFTNRPTPATAMALEEAGLWLIHKQAVQNVLLRHPQVALGVVERMAERVLQLVTLAADLSLRSVEARLARLLLAEAQDGVMERRRWTTQAELAARLGTVPDVLNRALRGLSEAGFIQVDRRQIRILDREGLAGKAMLEG